MIYPLKSLYSREGHLERLHEGKIFYWKNAKKINILNKNEMYLLYIDTLY